MLEQRPTVPMSTLKCQAEGCGGAGKGSKPQSDGLRQVLEETPRGMQDCRAELGVRWRVARPGEEMAVWIVEGLEVGEEGTAHSTAALQRVE